MHNVKPSSLTTLTSRRGIAILVAVTCAVVVVAAVYSRSSNDDESAPPTSQLDAQEPAVSKSPSPSENAPEPPAAAGVPAPVRIVDAGPATGTSSPEGDAAPQDVSHLIGLTEDEATAAAIAEGLSVRISRRDTESFMGTTDYTLSRVNFEVESGRVVSARIG